MRVRFQADADLNLAIVLAVVRREPAVDFQAAHVAGLARRPDPEVLLLSASDGRLLVTHDQKTMPDHFAEFVAKETSLGLAIVPQHLPVSVVVDELLLIWGATEHEEWINRICYLPL